MRGFGRGTAAVPLSSFPVFVCVLPLKLPILLSSPAWERSGRGGSPQVPQRSATESACAGPFLPALAERNCLSSFPLMPSVL